MFDGFWYNKKLYNARELKKEQKTLFYKLLESVEEIYSFEPISVIRSVLKGVCQFAGIYYDHNGSEK